MTLITSNNYTDFNKECLNYWKIKFQTSRVTLSQSTKLGRIKRMKKQALMDPNPADRSHRVTSHVASPMSLSQPPSEPAISLFVLSEHTEPCSWGQGAETQSHLESSGNQTSSSRALTLTSCNTSATFHCQLDNWLVIGQQSQYELLIGWWQPSPHSHSTNWQRSHYSKTDNNSPCW